MSLWPIARVALAMMFRRKLFWVLYAFGLLIFLMFFFGQYLLAWAETQAAASRSPPSASASRVQAARPDRAGCAPTSSSTAAARRYRIFFWYQGYMVMIVLALAGSILVGNDFQFGSLPFYLSKPLCRWHYLLGKCLAVGRLHQPDDHAAGPGPVRAVRAAAPTGTIFPTSCASCCSASSAMAWC